MRERYGLGLGTTMGTLQTTFRCWDEVEPSSDTSDDSDGDGEKSCGYGGVSRRSGEKDCGRTCLGEGRQLVHCPTVVVRLEEKGEGEQVVPPLGEVGSGGVVEPGSVVWMGEDGMHGWR